MVFLFLNAISDAIFLSCPCQKNTWLSTGDDLKHPAHAPVSVAYDPSGKGIGDREIVRHPHGLNGTWLA